MRVKNHQTPAMIRVELALGAISQPVQTKCGRVKRRPIQYQ